MEPVIGLFVTFVVGSSIWVGIDAWSIGARKGLLPGIVDLGPVGWLFACLGLWVIAFPLYLISRGDLIKAVEAEKQAAQREAKGRPSPESSSLAHRSPADGRSASPRLDADAAAAAAESDRSNRLDGSDRPDRSHRTTNRYKVRLAAGEFGPFNLARLQEFVGTGQLQPEAIVVSGRGETLLAKDVPGLRFPGIRAARPRPEMRSGQGAASPTLLPNPSSPPSSSPSSPSLPPPSSPSLPPPPSSPSSLPSSPQPDSAPADGQEATAAPEPSARTHRDPVDDAPPRLSPPSPDAKDRAGAPRAAASPAGAAAPTTADRPPRTGIAPAPSPSVAPSPPADRGASGAEMGSLALLVLIAVLLAVSLVLRLAAPPPRGRWEHRVSSAADGEFEEHFDELGEDGWQIVTCRRARVSVGSPRVFRYECVLKRRASSS